MTFLVFTAIYLVALYVSIQRYNAWVQDLIAKYEARGIPPGYIDPNPYRGTFEGGLLICLGTALAVSWVVLILRGGRTR